MQQKALCKSLSDKGGDMVKHSQDSIYHPKCAEFIIITQTPPKSAAAAASAATTTRENSWEQPPITDITSMALTSEAQDICSRKSSQQLNSHLTNTNVNRNGNICNSCILTTSDITHNRYLSNLHEQTSVHVISPKLMGETVITDIHDIRMPSRTSPSHLTPKPFQTSLLNHKTLNKYLAVFHEFRSNVRLSSVFISLFIFLNLLSSQVALGFNVDTRTAVVQTGDEGSMFGFSVSQHLDGGQHWLLIGAPRQQTDQPGVKRAGAVFRCKTDTIDCHQVPFDTRGNQRPWNGSERVQIEKKSDQWLGATVYSAGVDGIIVACAPRYVYYTEDRNRREPVGTCYVGMGSTTRFLEYSPCKSALDDYELPIVRDNPDWDGIPIIAGRGSAQLGWSAAVSRDGKNIIMGAVGSYYWQGQLFSQALKGKADPLETLQLNNSDLHDNTYKGYSMVIGQFSGTGSEDYVVGIPREGLTGRVAVYNSLLEEMGSVLGEQMGEYFGYSLAVGDFNGDGLDDLAVGAPFHTDYDSDAYETGRVHVFYQNDRQEFAPERTRIKGAPHSRSRFGLAVTGLKDINRDGYDDLAVGAPYGGTLNQGAVYIFHGSESGIQKEHSQIVHAADISPKLSSFGYSLSGGLDQDNNNYPDILVGSYESDSAVFLRSRPIVHVTATVSTTPPVINLEKQLCYIGKKRARRAVTCFTVTACVEYMGMRVESRIELDLKLSLDFGKNLTHRAYFMDTDRNTTFNKRITLAKKKEKCFPAKCYIKEDIRDKLNPVGIKMSYELVQTENPAPDYLQPIMNQAALTYTESWTHIKKDCGSDDVCIPELDLQAYSLVARHVHGTATDIDLQVVVQNFGEDSYESQLHLQLPYGVSYVQIHHVQPEGEVKCLALTKELGNEIICDVGNPLQTMKMVNFTIKAKAKEVNDTEYLHFLFNLNSTNPENSIDLSNNYAVVDVPLVAVTDIQVTGVSNPEQILYNHTYIPQDIVSDVDIGPQVIHLYEVRNEGPSNVSLVSVVIEWPTHFAGDYPLMYLPIMPQVVRGEGTCKVQDLNPFNLTVTETEVEVDLSMFDDLHRKLEYKREKRSIDGRGGGVYKRSLWEDDNSVKRLACGVEQLCTSVSCEVTSLNAGDSALIQITSRVWIKTIIQLQEVYPGIIIRSEAIGQVMEVPYKVKTEEYSIDTFQIETYIAALNQRPRKEPLQFWVIAIAVFCGCLLLLLLILCLWRVGFFHRKTVDDMALVPVYTGTVEKQANVENNGTGTAIYCHNKNGMHQKYDSIPSDLY